MPAITVPGQSRAEEILRTAAARNSLSHACLITGGSTRADAARFAAAAYQCTAANGRPCGVCQDCRKVAQNIHPDVITVEDPEHKNISVEVIRDIRADAYVRPNEARRKVYLIDPADGMNANAQNAFLKVLEEEPDKEQEQYFGELKRNMWCTGSIFHMAGKTVTSEGEIVPLEEAKEAVYTYRPIRVTCSDEGRTVWAFDDTASDRFIFHINREDLYEKAMTKALAAVLAGL